MKDYKKYNAEAVLDEVNILINNYEKDADKAHFWSERPTGYKMEKVYDRLSIFDWWNDYLSLTQL